MHVRKILSCILIRTTDFSVPRRNIYSCCVLIALAFLLNSCGVLRNTQLEKRRYRKGYHIDKADQGKAKTNDQSKESFMIGKNFFSINTIPLESLRLGYGFLINRRVMTGTEFSIIYPTLFLGKSQLNAIRYSTYTYTDYFTLNQPMLLFAPFIRVYFKKNKDAPCSGFYFKAAGNITGIIDGIKTDYYNRQNIPDRVDVDNFLSMQLNNKVLVKSDQFSTWGYDLLIGYAVYTTDQHRFLFDVAAGYHYFHLPEFIKQDRIINGETFYYHDTPLWRNPLNFPVCTQLSILYKF